MPPTPQAHVDSLAPYAVAEPPAPGAWVLSANESAHPPSPRAVRAMADTAAQGHRYGADAADGLRHALAEAHGLDPDRILCGNGSSELIALAMQVFAGPGRTVLMPRYSYLYLATAARASGAYVRFADAPGLGADPQALRAALTPETRVVCLANPNNPTGHSLSAAQVRELHAALPADVLLLLDAAYGDYVADPDYDPGHALARDADNVLVLRTFSKAYGLAGLRVGWAEGAPALIDALHRCRVPNNVSAVAQAGAQAALADRAHLARVLDDTRAAAAQTAAALRRLGLEVGPAAGNFLLVGLPAGAGAAAYRRAKADGVYVRPMDVYGLPDHLRVTLGEAEGLAALVRSLDRALAGRGAPA
jgi:histidinol-phosphate aminotransferase